MHQCQRTVRHLQFGLPTWKAGWSVIIKVPYEVLHTTATAHSTSTIRLPHLPSTAILWLLYGYQTTTTILFYADIILQLVITVSQNKRVLLSTQCVVPRPNGQQQLADAPRKRLLSPKSPCTCYSEAIKSKLTHAADEHGIAPLFRYGLLARITARIARVPLMRVRSVATSLAPGVKMWESFQRRRSTTSSSGRDPWRHR